jgi:hypothetical protein
MACLAAAAADPGDALAGQPDRVGVEPARWSRRALTVALPFRLIGIAVESVFALLRAVLTLPARVLGGGPTRA